MVSKQTSFLASVPKKARKKIKRRSFDVKASHIIHMMEKNTDYHEALHGHREFGYRMSQIADMIAYAPSTALLNDLLAMADRRMLYVEVLDKKGPKWANCEYVFYVPSSAPRGRKRKLI